MGAVAVSRSKLSPNASFERCLALLRRGLVSGGDVAELYELFEGALQAVGVVLGDGFGFESTPPMLNIPPDWPIAHNELAAFDPTPEFFARKERGNIFNISRHATKQDLNGPLFTAFKKSGLSDSIVARVGEPHEALWLAVYRSGAARPFDEIALARLSALLPWVELAFTSRFARQALDASPNETTAEALRRIHAYALIDANAGPVVYSKGARELLTTLFGSFGPRGEKRVERALRTAFDRFTRSLGPRCVRLRADLIAELALIPKKDADATILASFVSRPTHDPTSPQVAVFPHEELLSPRQRIVAREAALGASIPSIAERLQISTESVRMHVTEIYRRLGIASRVELAMFYATVTSRR